MPSATTFDDDLDDRPSRKPAAPRKQRAPAGKGGKRKGHSWRIDTTKVARYAALGMTVSIGVGILVNALVLQKGHHPAPLFGKSITLADPPAPKPAPVRTATRAPEPATTTNDATATAPAPPSKARFEAAARTDGDDPIGRLLARTGATSVTEKPQPARTVLGVQQALVKLGFVVKPTGTFGPQTKKAIELFEKDRHLPVKGEVSRRLVKVLAAESGVKID